MNDLEICKRIAEIEGLEVATPKEASAREYNDNVCVILPDGKHAGGSFSYSPLTDDAFCFQLMVKYKVKLEWLDFCEPVDTGTWSAHINENSSDVKYDTSPSKAICLVIIKAHNE